MKKKNLLYIFADQWRYHAVGCSHEDPVKTPNMDEFAAESLICDNAISTYPLCSPHRAALLTGKHPLNCRMWTNCKIGLKDILMLFPQEKLISDVLHENGYDTSYIGKWHLDASELNFNPAPASGAKNWDAYTPAGERRHHFDFWHSYGAMDEHLDPHYWEDCETQIKPGKWSVEHETDVLLSHLDENRSDAPFCAFLSWNPPHPPYDQVPEKYLELYPEGCQEFRPNVPQEMISDPDYRLKWRQYFSAVSGLDEQFGRIISYLKENGLYDDTLIILSADHGDCMGSHGLYGKNIWYEESIRIPLVIHGCGVKAGRSDTLLVSADHMPTILDLLGIEIPSTVDGISHAGVLRGNLDACLRSDCFLCMVPGMPELVERYERLGLNNRAFGWRGVRDKRYTYVVDNGTDPEAEQKRYLYDNLEDPYQMSPQLLEKDDEACRKYDKLLLRHLAENNDPFAL